MRRGLVLASTVLLGACQSNVVGPAPLRTVEVGFAADVAPVLQQSCGGGACHVEASAAGVDVSSHAALLASVGDGYGDRVVRPGDAAGSPLVDKLGASPRVGARMPLGGAPLDADARDRIRAWIDAGARND